MKTQQKLILSALMIASVSLAGPLAAQETTGSEFSELVSALNNQLTEAKARVEQIEQQRIAEGRVNPKELLPTRAKALKELGNITKKFDKETNPELKKELSQRLEEQVMKVSELSTNFIESMKNDLVAQDKQLEIIEESLADVTMKMDKLKTLAAKGVSGMSPELSKYRARKSLHSLAQMVEVFAEKHANSQQWSSIRRTIMLQDKILSRSSLASDKVQRLLEAQQKVYEQVLAQVAIARRGLQSEKQVLAQVALGEVAKTMLRKAAGLLMGNQSITQLGEAAFVKSEYRQEQVLTFLEQDEDEELYSGMNSDAASDPSGGMPAGYKEYLQQSFE